MRKLTDADINQELRQLPGWEHSGNTLVRMFDRRTFQGAISFVNTIAEIAQRADHHPDLDIRYNKVRVTLTTHDAGTVTDRDIAVARQITAAAD